jgi:biopolymer transport protein TolR
MPFGRLQRSRPAAPMSEINMTPLIDVMLVLLAIFIITAPLMASGLKLDLPASDAAQPTSGGASIDVAIDRNGRWLLDGEAVSAESLRMRAAGQARTDPQTEVRLQADRHAPYGDVARLIGIVQQAGLSRIALVTEADPERAGR